jgi:hypothetical protein
MRAVTDPCPSGVFSDHHGVIYDAMPIRYGGQIDPTTRDRKTLDGLTAEVKNRPHEIARLREV